MGLGLSEMLIGQDPLEVEALWERLYVGSAMNGRRGAVVNAIGALDMALHDLRGKALGRPCHELLGDLRPEPVTPYASLQPDVSSFTAYRDSLVEWATRAKDRGFRAIKTEVTLSGPYAHKGLSEPHDRMTEILHAVRSAIGSEVDLLVDVQYAFASADEALAVMSDWRELNLFFVETPLWPDDLAGHRRLVEEQPIPIASGEWLTTRFEFLPLLDTGVQVVQPDIGRVGGLTEARRVCELAGERGRTIVPHVWKTGISIAAALHLAVVTPHCRFIEYLPADLTESGLRKDLVPDALELVDGCLLAPSAPGLGVEIDRAALEHYRV
jgi:L-alanine-DL-glutamate epimerase-like enolase superfamily enzyme